LRKWSRERKPGGQPWKDESQNQDQNRKFDDLPHRRLANFFRRDHPLHRQRRRQFSEKIPGNAMARSYYLSSLIRMAMPASRRVEKPERQAGDAQRALCYAKKAVVRSTSQ
jgi:hypothetical protein